MKKQKMKETTLDIFDIAILGGGIAGLTLALQIKKARPQTSILVVEKQEHPVPEAAHKVGESTVEIQAFYLRDVLGLQEHLQTRNRCIRAHRGLYPGNETITGNRVFWVETYMVVIIWNSRIGIERKAMLLLYLGRLRGNALNLPTRSRCFSRAG